MSGAGQSLQLGDLGIFTERDLNLMLRYGPDSSRHRVFRGNHDNPHLIKQLPHYLGDWGYLERQDLFFLAGGYSIDAQWRVPGVSWWPDEELDSATLKDAIELYASCHPRFVVTHEAPSEGKRLLLHAAGRRDWNIRSSTELVLSRMLDIHRPDIWVFGHHHFPLDVVSGGTRFVGLAEMKGWGERDCLVYIPELEW